MTTEAGWASLPTPAAVVDVTRLDANVAEMADRMATSGVALRPHFKTSKCLQVARRQLAAGAVGMTCSTPAEVTVLAENGITGSLWAHQPVGPAKVDFAVWAVRGWQTLLLADSVAVARPLSNALAAAGVEAELMLEVNTGHARTGVDPDRAVATAREIDALPGLRVRGVVTHEGHLAGHPDRAERERHGRETSALLVSVAESLRAQGIAADAVSVGSTPGASSTPFVAGVTEARPGTYVYFDANQLRLGSCTPEQCALTVLATVVSAERPGTVIVDAGVKAMSSDTITPETGVGLVWDLTGRPMPDVAFTTANEEHGFLTGAGTAGLRVGDRLRLLPNHACGTVNMWSQVFAWDGTGYEEWSILARH